MKTREELQSIFYISYIFSSRSGVEGENELLRYFEIKQKKCKNILIQNLKQIYPRGIKNSRRIFHTADRGDSSLRYYWSWTT